MPVTFPVGSIRMVDFNSHIGKRDADGGHPARAIEWANQDDGVDPVLEPGGPSLFLMENVTTQQEKR